MQAAQHDPAYRAFRRRLRTAREEAGLSQTEVARRMKKTQSWVSKSESGERRVDIIELSRLARLYDKPIDWFVP